MNQKERDELVALQGQLQGYLAIVEDDIITYPANGDDDTFNFLLRKAVYYQQMLKKIKRELNTSEES